jgi:ATP-binding cassette subfamily B protein
LLLGEFALAILSDLLGRMVSYADGLLSELFTNATSIRLMEHAATLDLEDFEDPDLQDKLDRARRQTMGRMNLMSQLFGQVQDTITVISFAIGLLVYAPWLMLLLAIALVPAFVGEAHFNALNYSLNFQWTPNGGNSNTCGRWVPASRPRKRSRSSASIASSCTLQAAVGQVLPRQQGARRQARVLGHAAGRTRHARGTTSPTPTLRGATVKGDFFHRRPDLPRRQLPTPAAVARRIADRLFAGCQPGAIPRRPVFILRDRAGDRVEARCLRVPRPIVRGFIFENVGFRYPDAARWALRELNFELHAGEVLALVGENGAGKTTLVKLLARLYDPDEGRILLDGRDLRDYDLDDLRANIGVIFQDFVRYHLTAGENIGVGQIDAMDDCQRSDPRARRGADEVIAGLPMATTS